MQQFNIDGDSFTRLQQLLQLPKWGDDEIKHSFLLWLRCAKDKGDWKLSLEQALQFSTTALDEEGIHIVTAMWTGSEMTPKELFNQYATIFTYEMFKQVQFLNHCLSTAIVAGLRPDYSPLEYLHYSISPDSLLRTIEKELDRLEILGREVDIKDKMKEADLGKYAEELRQNLAEKHVKVYRQLLEENKLIDFLKEKEEGFLEKIKGSKSQGFSEQQAINVHWKNFIQHRPSPVMTEFGLLIQFNGIHAEGICQIIIKKLKKLTDKDFLLAGDDSGLKNLWEEYCVQVQGEHSVYWELYRETIDDFIIEELNTQPEAVKVLLSYMQSLERDDDTFSEAQSSYVYDEDCAVTEIRNHLLAKATAFKNRNIDRYQDRE